jgi:predicted dehydrogenase
MSKLRFGICGLGFMGRGHFTRLQAHPCAEVVAVCDQDPARRAGDWPDDAGNLAAMQAQSGRTALAGVVAYESPQELIANPNVDVVLITLPTFVHAAVTVAALQAGKHVLCEKPMALRPNDCRQMVAAARTSGRTLMVAQCIRFWPQYELIKRYVSEGRLGRVLFATLRRVGTPPQWSAGHWLLNGKLSGGAILDLHVHDIDYVQYLLGVPDEIYARGQRGVSGEIDHVVATYAYPDGRYVTLEGGWVIAAPHAFDMEITVHGERGTLGWALSRGDDVWHTDVDGTRAISVAGDALRNELDYFIECVQSGRPPERCTPSSTRTSIILCWIERRAIELGRPVVLGARLKAQWGL